MLKKSEKCPWLREFKVPNVSLTPIFSLLILIFLNHSVFAQSNSTISFTKKEIAFFKWGEGDNQIRLKKGHSHHNGQATTEEVNVQYYWPRDLKIDGTDDVYIQDGKGHTFIISSVDGSVKTVNVGGFRAVDEAGNMYSLYYVAGEPYGLIVTKPDGTQKIYKNFDMKYEENGIAYDLNNNKAITIFDNGDQPEKLPPQLFSRWLSKNYDGDFKKEANNLFSISTKKINKHLKKINRRIDSDQIQIKIEKKNSAAVEAYLLGVDDDGESYFLCGYRESIHLTSPWSDIYVRVYSQAGVKIAEIPIDSDYFDKHVSGFALDIHGNFFQMLASEDGMHILKWIKN